MIIAILKKNEVMKATIGVYDTHEEAVEAIRELKNAGYPLRHLSIIGKLHTEYVHNNMEISEEYPIRLGGIEVTTALGITLGVLTGVGLFAIPGVGFLFGAGAITGAIAGLDFGLMGGGLVSVLTNLGMKDEIAKQYLSDIEDGRYLVVAQGDSTELENAKTILLAHGTHTALETHA